MKRILSIFAIALSVSLLSFLAVKIHKVNAQLACQADENNLIVVFETGGACQDLQAAINAVPDNTPGYTIEIRPGTYTIPDSGQVASIYISNKTDLKIIGIDYDGSSQTTKNRLVFAGNSGGIEVNNSELIFIEKITLDGSTSNGIFRVKDSSQIEFNQFDISDNGANAIQVNNSDTVTFKSGLVYSPNRVGIYFSNTTNTLVSSVRFVNSGSGVYLASSDGTIEGSLFENIDQYGISLSGNNIGWGNIISNTFVHINPNYEYMGAIGFRQFTNNPNVPTKIYKNVFAYNTTALTFDENSYTENVKIELNNFWENQISQRFFESSGVKVEATLLNYNKNIFSNPFSTDPAATNYATHINSPAAYGIVEFGEYMGYSITSSGVYESPAVSSCNGADINQSGKVEINDLLILSREYGNTCQ